MEEKTHSSTVDEPKKGKQAASPKDDEYEVVYEVVYETDSEGSSDQNSSDEEVEYEYVTEIVDEKGNVGPERGVLAAPSGVIKRAFPAFGECEAGSGGGPRGHLRVRRHWV